MPVRSQDVFLDVTAKFNKNSNAFVGKLLQAQTDGSLQIASGPTLKHFPGAWREKFKHVSQNSRKKLIVEIGCHTGHTICDMAEAHPDVLFVGIDITFKRVYQTAERAEQRQLKNVFSILANAGGLGDLFASGEVDGFVTFFPDPWKKKKHAHYRLYSNQFCSTTWNLLAPGGFLWLKTDYLPYFTDACELAAHQGFKPTDTLPIFMAEEFSSLFLRRFTLQGVDWYNRKWIKFDS
jgi:tRNA (guanine-N(7)-)-methyltransferase